jgi:hypothetical protein
VLRDDTNVGNGTLAAKRGRFAQAQAAGSARSCVIPPSADRSPGAKPRTAAFVARRTDNADENM